MDCASRDTGDVRSDIEEGENDRQRSLSSSSSASLSHADCDEVNQIGDIGDVEDATEVNASEKRSGGGTAAFDEYYAAQGLCGETEWRRIFELLHTPLPPCFRIRESCGSENASELLDLLSGWEPEAVRWCPGAYRITSARAVGEDGHYDPELDRALSSAQQAGRLSRQETASMLPAIALPVESHHWVLELCAAPGSKTLQILDIMHNMAPTSQTAQLPAGLLVANDVKLVRLRKLIDRTRRVAATPLLATCVDARRFPCLQRAGCPLRVRFDRVYCDVPCSGDGTARKARGLISRWTPRAGLAHHEMQLAILRRGIDLLSPGGVLAYSTCALNPVECEAVVAAAVTQAAGMVELVPISVHGLNLAPGLTSWRVPAWARAPEASSASPKCSTYASWDEVREGEKSSGRIRRSMFPPLAYASSASAAASVSEQLTKCGRLLPMHDDGGCFFLALLRRTTSCRSLKRGDRVLVHPFGYEAIVRKFGSGKFIGLVRVAYPDGSFFHVDPKDLELLGSNAVSKEVLEASLNCIDDVDYVSTPSSPLPVPVNAVEEQNGLRQRETLLRPMAVSPEWKEIADFYGLIDEPRTAAAAGVRAFPLEALVEGLASSGTRTLCLASPSLQHVTRAPRPRAAGRAVFFRSVASGGDPPTAPVMTDMFSWRPAIEAASFLALHCTRRVLRISSEAIANLLHVREVGAAELGIEAWEPGSIIVVSTAATASTCSTSASNSFGLCVVGSLRADGRVQSCTRRSIASHFLAILGLDRKKF
eukprot:TRINITY_DN42223_c0_g1_i1.p1 TRINITY_DN42223_c0_g1~~TRINITY_DN42223_c0_g1_i1.p1  ORF type:complete len:775 (+),score=93.04 TRINITY_DN42223_c0_g1_i1:32-2326(+)